MTNSKRAQAASGNATLNKAGKYVPAIPEPFHGLKMRCDCGKTFWSRKAYRGHYALEHILQID